ncbi:hypothetical protein [Nocardia sp. NPDC060259]|uniref:hypothetical protein n=1 Tax=Nocardia sp. NPDC060259 TaxID=3347088 RepID=UPI0036617E15
MIDDDVPVTLTRCQRWALESLAAVAPVRNQSTTVYEFAAVLWHDTRQTGVYLGELHRLRLVQCREYAGGLLWWVNATVWQSRILLQPSSTEQP